jgi:hypothetical protein
MEYQEDTDIQRWLIMAKKLDDLDKPPTKRAKSDPTFSDRLICKKNLEDFSDEILLTVFSYVDTLDLLRLQQVNKRFHAICQDQSLCKRVEICNQNLPAEFIQKQLDGGCKYLKLNKCKIREMNLQSSQPSKLEHLNLNLCDFDEQSLKKLVSPCFSLKTLTLTNITLLSTFDVSKTEWFRCLFNKICLQNGPTLQVLRIRQIYTGKDTIQAIVANCLKLEELEWSTTYLTRNSIDCLVDHLTTKIVKLRLTRLKWDTDAVPYANLPSEITDGHIEKLVKRCTNLTVLDLSGITPLTINTLRSINKYLKSTLEELGVADTKILVDDLFELRALPALKILNYNCYAAAQFQRLKEQLPHLIIKDDNHQEINRGLIKKYLR